MKRTLLALAALALLAPGGAWADANVLNSDCLIYGTGLEIVPQIKPDCKDSLYIKVYSKEEIDLLFNHAAAREEERLKVLKQTLQSTLEDAVFKAAIQGDQIDRIEDEVWKRVAVKYRREIGEMEASLTALKAQAEEIRKSTEALQAKLQSLQPATAVPAASPAPGQP